MSLATSGGIPSARSFAHVRKNFRSPVAKPSIGSNVPRQSQPGPLLGKLSPCSGGSSDPSFSLLAFLLGGSGLSYRSKDRPLHRNSLIAPQTEREIKLPITPTDSVLSLTSPLRTWYDKHVRNYAPTLFGAFFFSGAGVTPCSAFCLHRPLCGAVLRSLCALTSEFSDCSALLVPV